MILASFDSVIAALQNRADEARRTRCVEIADQVVPSYRDRNVRHTGCTSHTAKRWQAAYDGAMLALGGRIE